MNMNMNMNMNKTPFITFCVASIVYLFPIIKADRYFIDDYNRAFLGYLSWSDNGRPLADLVMSLLNFNTVISDISPLTQIIGVASLAFVLLLIMRTETTKNMQSVACALCVLVSPFMLETLSYAYDSLPMLLSIAFVFIPFCIKLKNNYYTFLVHFFFIVSSLCLYQASIGIYVILAIFTYTLKDNKDRCGISTLAVNALSFILGYAVYSKSIARYFISGGYSLNRAQFINFTSADSFDLFFKNLFKYYEFLMLGYPGPLLAINTLIVLLGLIGVVIKSLEFLKHEVIFSKIAFIITLFSPLLVFSMVLAPLSVLANPPMMSRVLGSAGVVMMFFMFYAFRVQLKSIKVFLSILVVLCMMYSFSTVYAYGNAQKKQKEFESYIINMMHDDISFGKRNFFDIYGSAPTSPVSSLIVAQHPIMSWMVLSNITFRDEWRTNITLENFRFPAKYKGGSYPGDLSSPSCDFMIKQYNGIYTLFEKSGVILFYFRDKCSK